MGKKSAKKKAARAAALASMIADERDSMKQDPQRRARVSSNGTTDNSTTTYPDRDATMVVDNSPPVDAIEHERTTLSREAQQNNFSGTFTNSPDESTSPNGCDSLASSPGGKEIATDKPAVLNDGTRSANYVPKTLEKSSENKTSLNPSSCGTLTNMSNYNTLSSDGVDQGKIDDVRRLDSPTRLGSAERAFDDTGLQDKRDGLTYFGKDHFVSGEPVSNTVNSTKASSTEKGLELDTWTKALSAKNLNGTILAATKSTYEKRAPDSSSVPKKNWLRRKIEAMLSKIGKNLKSFRNSFKRLLELLARAVRC